MMRFVTGQQILLLALPFIAVIVAAIGFWVFRKVGTRPRKKDDYTEMLKGDSPSWEQWRREHPRASPACPAARHP
jgi:hypothetical protein